MDSDPIENHFIGKYKASEADMAKLDNNFKYHPPQEGQQERYVSIRDFGKEFAMHLTLLCPPSRELSLALTNLEQAVMWANAAIARNEKE